MRTWGVMTTMGVNPLAEISGIDRNSDRGLCQDLQASLLGSYTKNRVLINIDESASLPEPETIRNAPKSKPPPLRGSNEERVDLVTFYNTHGGC